MDKLQELRDAHFESQEKEALTLKVAKQLDDINKLKEEKKMLLYKLQALKDGCPDTDLYPSYAHQDPELVSLHNSVMALKQKLSLCRLLGPCGLTVLSVSSKSLAVSLTSVWKELRQSFVLHIADDEDSIKVTGSNIPYFIDVDSMISGEKSRDLVKAMDDLGYVLNAYTQRRSEVETVQEKHQTIVKRVTYNQPVTAVEIELAERKPPVTNSQDNNHTIRDVSLQVKFHLIYDDISNVYPNKVSLTSSHFISKDERSEIRELLKSKPLSESLPLIWEKLGSISLDITEEAGDV